MRTARRFVGDENGMTLALAMIMIVLIGAMGAGLLAFVNRDLTTVVEENRGQRAFEMADAGVWTAKRQLTSDCSSIIGCQGHYNGSGTPTLPDNQWSYSGSGMDLRDLNVDGDLTDWVNVTIQATGSDTFTVVSTGHYGTATRKIEAKLKAACTVCGGGGGGPSGSPIYFTPSSIQIEYDGTDGVQLKQVSLFSKKDILLPGLMTPADFSEDYNANSGNDPALNAIHRSNSDELYDWDSTNPAVFDPTGSWNPNGRINTTIRRRGGPNPTETVETEPFTQMGFAAVQKVCGYQPGDTTNGEIGTCPLTSVSIADGVSSYDSTTGSFMPDGSPNTNPPDANGPRPVVLNSALVDVARKCTFVLEPPPKYDGTNPCYISFPFPDLTPKPDVLMRRAQAADAPGDRHYWNMAVDGTPDWSELFPGGGGADRLVFIDAGNSDVDYNPSGQNLGMLVVWCGRLEMNEQYAGIIMNLQGDGSGFGASSCGPDTGGLFRNNGQKMVAWVYAQGGTDTRAGIELGPGSIMATVPSRQWSTLLDIFEEPVPTNFTVEGWRELYE